jgi:diaminohydroxyphosphoribosylaminopyrimidine deaminase/5-amino-6-(5-phosphoribosylamino)uracil reductase
VVFGCVDPNPAHAGRAVARLKEAGIEVSQGILAEDCEHLIRAFRKRQTTGLPWLVAKTAMTLDGRITRPKGEGQWLSSEASRTDVQLLRNEADAILSSGKTVRADNPRLTVRPEFLSPEKKQPWRVVLTSREDGVSADSVILTDDHADRTLVFTKRMIESVLRELVVEHEVSTILVESGGRLLGRLVDEGWIDELVVYLAPMVSGGPDTAVGGEGVASLSQRLGLGSTEVVRIGDDLRIRGLLQAKAFPLER